MDANPFGAINKHFADLFVICKKYNKACEYFEKAIEFYPEFVIEC